MRHIAHMVKNKNAYSVFVGNLKERHHLDHVGVLKRIYKETDRCNMDCINLAQDMEKWRGSYENGNKFLGYIKCKEFLDKKRIYYLLKKGFAP